MTHSLKLALILVLSAAWSQARAAVCLDAAGQREVCQYVLDGSGVAVAVSPSAPLPTAEPPIVGNGSQSVSASTAISGMTVNASGGALPATLTSLTVINLSATDAAICKGGGVCSCPENGVATTNGLTIQAAQGGYQLSLGGVASTVPTVVACSGTVILQYQW